MKPTETTDALLRGLSQARAMDVDRLFGSAVDVTISNYTGEGRRDHVERVSIPAEYAEPLRAALIMALESALRDRRDSLARQIIAIGNANPGDAG